MYTEAVDNGCSLHAVTIQRQKICEPIFFKEEESVSTQESS